ncbi:sulfotransferase domain-containing protein [Bradyrhizobium sp. HKCCYLS20291]|uniref:sulfotransferase domain-containing protein n=1 Tax=Bradyrhizobium sp. HKCCYLS20291 TaxID=3420766 RepID=UPI003EB81FB2
MSGLHVLASYMKSGNTWVRALLTALDDGHGTVDINALEGWAAADRAFFDETLDVDTSDLLPEEQHRLRPQAHRIATPPRARSFPIKVHDAWLPAPGASEPPLPRECIAAVVLIVRDPRDVAPSLATHLGRSIDEAIAFMADPGATLINDGDQLRTQLPQFSSSWSAHTLSWLRSGLPLTVVRYENLLADPLPSLTAIARAFGRSASADQFSAAIAAARFDVLQAAEVRTGFREGSLKAPGRFFGSGEAGGWRSRLTEAQADRIRRDHGAVMRELGYG